MPRENAMETVLKGCIVETVQEFETQYLFSLFPSSIYFEIKTSQMETWYIQEGTHTCLDYSSSMCNEKYLLITVGACWHSWWLIWLERKKS